MTTTLPRDADAVPQKTSLFKKVALWTAAGLCVSISAIASVTDEAFLRVNQAISDQIDLIETQESAVIAANQANTLLTPRTGLSWERASLPMVSNPVLLAELKTASRYDSQPDQLELAGFSMIEDVIAVDFTYPGMGPESALAPKRRGQAQWQCLAEALYFEARSESKRAQRAVAEVILNRVDSRRYPNTVCQVVNQGAHRKHKCQFSYNCDGVPERISEPVAWSIAEEIAKEMVVAKTRPLTNGATHYHTTAVRPSWSRKLTKVGHFGDHIFYTYNKRVSRR